MKYAKVRKDLALIAGPPLLLAGLLLFCFLPQAIYHFFTVFWLCIVLAIFLIITPFGNRKLGTPSLHWSYWFFSILLLEITLTGLYLGIATIAGTLLPINTPTHNMLFLTSMRAMLLHDGLFPWSLYALIAAGMGVLAYCEKTNAFFSNLMQSITKQNTEQSISLIANVGIRRITLFGVSTTFVLMTLLLISLFLPIEMHVVYGFYPAALLTTLFLLLISFTQHAKKLIERLFSRRVHTALIFPAFIIVLGLIILILSVITSTLTRNTAVTAPPTLIQHWIDYHWHTAWTIFSVMWWCSLTPVVAAFITRISRGYSIRAILIGVLILPLLVCLFFIAEPAITSITLSPFLIKILSLTSFLIIFPVLINHTNSSFAILSYFPKEGVIKHRDEHPFFQRIGQLTVVALYFYLVIGINGLSLFIFVPNYFTILTLLISSVAIVKNVFVQYKR